MRNYDYYKLIIVGGAERQYVRGQYCNIALSHIAIRSRPLLLACSCPSCICICNWNSCNTCLVPTPGNSKLLLAGMCDGSWCTPCTRAPLWWHYLLRGAITNARTFTFTFTTNQQQWAGREGNMWQGNTALSHIALPLHLLLLACSRCSCICSCNNCNTCPKAIASCSNSCNFPFLKLLLNLLLQLLLKQLQLLVLYMNFISPKWQHNTIYNIQGTKYKI